MVLQAAARLGETHQQCLRRMEEGLSLSSSTLPPYSGALLETARESVLEPALATAGNLASTLGVPHAPTADLGKSPGASEGAQRHGMGPESADEGGGVRQPEAPAVPEQERSWSLMSREDLLRPDRVGGNASADVRLFVGVLTAGKNVERRQAIRETWGADPRLHRWAAHLSVLSWHAFGTLSESSRILVLEPVAARSMRVCVGGLAMGRKAARIPHAQPSQRCWYA